MDYLTEFQKSILDECKIKKSGELSLPMGSGKTLISLCLTQLLKSDSNLDLIVVSKTLLPSWINEIKKFFNEELDYIILHKDYNKNLNSIKFNKDKKVLFLTTPQVLSKTYSTFGIENGLVYYEIINEGMFGQYNLKKYNLINKPLYDIPIDINNKKEYEIQELLYGLKWNSVIIDEVQNYTNIETKQCQSIISVYSKYKWGISGTILNEPKINNIFGYFMLINDKKIPRDIPSATEYIRRNKNFKGIKETFIYRETNEMYKSPKKNVNIIEHTISEDEYNAYICMKNIIQNINKNIKETYGDKTKSTIDIRRKLNASLLAMIVYIRQVLLCPIIPYSSMLLELSSLNNDNNIVNDIIRDNIKKSELNEYFDNPCNLKSSRIKVIMDIINNHSNSKIIIFSSFRVFIDLIKTYIPNCYTLESKYSMEKRNEILSDFEKDKKSSILLLTYQLGAEGLNLQFCNTVILCDLWWNDAVMSQAIARIDRYGQNHNELNIYYLTSNTCLETEIIKKNDTKNKQLKELMVGNMKTHKHVIKIDKILSILEKGENKENLINMLNEKRK